MKLSIIIPVFNEEKTVVDVLQTLKALVLKAAKKEIIVVNDGSTDDSELKILALQARWKNSKLDKIKLFSHPKNLGKGAAVRTGIENATGNYILIQDADLEYNPKDIEKLLEPVQEGKTQVVYGTRLKRLPNFYKDERTPRFIIHYLGNKFLSLLTSVLYGQWITDMETCYKLFPKEALTNISIRSKGFDFEPEITSKLLKRGYKIIEVPISTNPRGYNEGKKLSTIHDGLIALVTLFRYRIQD